jgi:hypothetical protein
MKVGIRIRGKKSSPKLQSEGRIGLEEAIEDFLRESGGTGEVGYGGSGSMGWDTEVTDVDEDEVEGCLNRLAGFLREWGAPTDTTLHVFTPNDEVGEPASAVSKHDGLSVRVFPEIS